VPHVLILRRVVVQHKIKYRWSDVLFWVHIDAVHVLDQVSWVFEMLGVERFHAALDPKIHQFRWQGILFANN